MPSLFEPTTTAVRSIPPVFWCSFRLWSYFPLLPFALVKNAIVYSSPGDYFFLIASPILSRSLFYTVRCTQDLCCTGTNVSCCILLLFFSLSSTSLSFSPILTDGVGRVSSRVVSQTTSRPGPRAPAAPAFFSFLFLRPETVPNPPQGMVRQRCMASGEDLSGNSPLSGLAVQETLSFQLNNPPLLFV